MIFDNSFSILEYSDDYLTDLNILELNDSLSVDDLIKLRDFCKVLNERKKAGEPVSQVALDFDVAVVPGYARKNIDWYPKDSELIYRPTALDSQTICVYQKIYNGYVPEDYVLSEEIHLDELISHLQKNAA